MEKSCRRVLVQNRYSSPHLQVFGASQNYWASKSEIIYFAPNKKKLYFLYLLVVLIPSCLHTT